MDSIAKNEFKVINFLVRNFSERLTMRSIAMKLNLSAAGVHVSLKKLEKSKIVVAEKLGTGLFYKINLNDAKANHLAALVLLGFYKTDIPKEISSLDKEIKAVMLKGKDLLLVTGLLLNPLKEFKTIIIDYEGLVAKIKEKDKGILKIIKEGSVVFGEDIILSAIKEVVR